jgi:HAE1 family hydrophobic/amphiphilic exporter-1
MLASRMLTKPMLEDHGALGHFGGAFARVYQWSLQRCLNAPLVVIVASVLFAGAALVAFSTVKSELTPNEDRAMVMMRLTAPQGSSLEYTRDKLQLVEEYLQPLVDGGDIRNVFSISGQGGSANSGFMVLTLAPWGERDRTQAEIVQDINRAASRVPALRGNAISSNSLRIRGAGSGLQMALVGNDYDRLTAAAVELVQALDATGQYDTPRLTNEPTQAQVSVTIDRERASDLGIDITGLSTAMQSLLEGRSVVDVFVNGDAYPVLLTSTMRPIDDPTDLENVFLKTGEGKIVPMSVIASMKEGAVAPQLNRESQLASVAITAGLKEGMSLGDAVKQVAELAEPILPPGARLIPLAEAATLEENSTGMALTFGFAIVIIFLVLAAQFERPRAARRRHGEERYLDRRVRQPAPRPRGRSARGDRTRLCTAAAPGHDDDDRHHPRRRSAGLCAWRRRGSAHRARLGDRRRTGFRNAGHAPYHAGRLSAGGALCQATCA